MTTTSSCPDYDNYHRIIEKHPSASIVCCPSLIVNENSDVIGRQESLVDVAGPVVDFLARQAMTNCTYTPAVVVSRNVYERKGGFIESLRQCADWEMWFRAGLCGLALSLTNPHCLYRTHGGNETNQSILSGISAKENIEVSIHCVKQLPPNLRRKVSIQLHYKKVSDGALHISRQLGSKFQWRGAFVQSLWALRLQPNRSTLYWAGKALFHYMTTTLKHSLGINRQLWPRRSFIKLGKQSSAI